VKVLPQTKPRPRLLTSIVAASHQPVVDPIELRNRLGRHRRATRLLARAVIATVVIAGGAVWFYQHQSVQEQEAVFRRLITVGTRMLSAGGHPSNAPAPIVVQLNADLIQVTSIALGHPRLAVVNGKRVGEGDYVTVHTPVRSIAITLRVLEISDRQVKLSDGTQTITVHLTLAPTYAERAQASPAK
jgi:hypothetical protein